jgi:hypothetical protein
MKKIPIELPLFIISLLCCIAACKAQDTTKAQLMIVQGRNFHKVVTGYVVTVKDSCTCKPIAFLTIRKQPFTAKYRVADYYIPIKPKGTN